MSKAERETTTHNRAAQVQPISGHDAPIDGRSTGLTRRAVLAGTAAVAATAGAMVPPAFASAEPDPVLELARQYRAAEVERDAAEDAYLDVWAALPDWAIGDPIYPDTKQHPEFRNARGCLGNRIPLSELRQFNAMTESLVDGWRDMKPGAERNELRAEWIRRRREGRARVAWWKAETRRQDQAQAAAGIPQLREAADDALARFIAIKERLIATPAISIEGLVAKMSIAAERFDCEGSDVSCQEVTAFLRPLTEDAARLAGGVS